VLGALGPGEQAVSDWPSHICMDCGRGWGTPWRNCCQTHRKSRFAFVGDGYLQFWRWMAQEKEMEFEDWKYRYGYSNIEAEFHGQLRLPL
jgi:hypothetical protein